MGERVSFILEIILRLKDQASTQLAAIRKEIRGINTDAKNSAQGFDAINSSISSMTRRLGNLNERLALVKSTVSQLGDDDDFAKMATAIDLVGTKLNKITGKRTVQVEVEEVGTEGATERPRGVARRDARARLAEQQARVAEQEAQAANEEALRALNAARQQAAREGRVFEEPTALRQQEVELRKVNLDAIAEQFRIQENINEEGKKRWQILKGENDELVAERATKKRAERFINDESARLARRLLIAQARAAQEAQAAAIPKPEAAEEVSEELGAFGFTIKEAGKKFKILDDTTGDIVSTHKSYELAVKKLARLMGETEASVSDEAEASKESATIKKKSVDAELEKLPEVEKEIDGIKKLTVAQRKVVDALEGELISIKFVSGSLGEKVAVIVNRLDDGTIQFSRKLDEAGEEIRGSLMQSKIDPTLRRPPIAGGGPSTGGFGRGDDDIRVGLRQANEEVVKFRDMLVDAGQNLLDLSNVTKQALTAAETGGEPDRERARNLLTTLIDSTNAIKEALAQTREEGALPEAAGIFDELKQSNRIDRETRDKFVIIFNDANQLIGKLQGTLAGASINRGLPTNVATAREAVFDVQRPRFELASRFIDDFTTDLGRTVDSIGNLLEKLRRQSEIAAENTRAIEAEQRGPTGTAAETFLTAPQPSKPGQLDEQRRALVMGLAREAGFDDIIDELESVTEEVKTLRTRLFELGQEHRHEVAVFMSTITDQYKATTEDEFKGLKLLASRIPANREEALNILYDLELRGQPSARLVELIDIFADEMSVLQSAQDRLREVTARAGPVGKQFADQARELERQRRDAFRQERGLPPIGGGAPGAGRPGGGRDELDEFTAKLRNANAALESMAAMARMTVAALHFREQGELPDWAREQPAIEGAAPGGGRPPKKPPTPVRTAEEEFGDDQERSFQRHAKAVQLRIADFERVEHALDSLRRAFIRGEAGEQIFFSTAEELRKEMERLAKDVPVNWQKGVNAAQQFFGRAQEVSRELEGMRKLKDVMGDREEFLAVARAFDQIKVAINDVNNAIELTRGGMQIFRREGERMKDLGIAGLSEEMNETFLQWQELRAQEVKAEREGTTVTKTVERQIQRLASRINAQREALRQLLELELQATRVTPGAPVREEDTSVVDEEDVDTTNKQTEATRELIARTLELQQKLHRVHADLDAGRIDRATAVGDFEELGRQFAALSRTRGIDALSGTARQLRGLTRQAKEAAGALKDAEKESSSLSKTVSEQEESEAAIEALAARFEELDQQVERGGLDARTASVHFGRLTEEFRRISRNADAGGDRALRFGLLAQRSAERARRAHQDLSAEVGGTGNMFLQLANAINRVTLRANALGGNVAKIDNQLRGLAVLGVIVFAQQLLTAMLGLGGSLVTVGSSAVFAAGAIGGTLVSGIAQALPMVGLLAAALSQVGSVTDALNQADLVKQQQFGRQQQQRQEAARGGGEELERANRLANANDGLRAAEDRVGDANRRLADSNRGLEDAQRNQADAQEQLTLARQEARDNLQELIQAERDAELAARGAALSQQEAQDRLAEAVRSGDLLTLQRAELGVLEAGQTDIKARRDLTGAREAVTVGRDIENLPDVVAAKRQVEDANRDVADANRQIADSKRGIEDADRAVGKAQRGLQTAKVEAADAGAETFAAADKLEFLLQQMTPAQRRLYEALVKIRSDFKRVFTPITDIIIDSFARGVNTADKILRSAIFLRTARDQATELSAAFDRIRIHFFEDPERLSQIFQIMRDGTENIRPLSRIFENVGDSLLNIAEQSAPAFAVIIDWFDDLSRDIRDITENHDAMDEFFGLAAKHAVGWLDLVKNVGIFFAVLAGQGEAEGFTLLEDFNQAVVNATEWLREHEEEVRIFFHDAGEVTRVLAGLLVEIAKAILQVFDPDRMAHLATFIEQTLIPALVTVVEKVGGAIDVILRFLDIPLVGDLAQFAIVVALIGSVVTGASGALIFFGLQFGHFLSIIGRVVAIFGRVNPLVGRFAGLLGTIVSKIPLLRPLASIFAPIAAGLGARGAARAGTSVVDDVLDIADGPSATTRGGRRVTTQRRPGIMGKLGLRKLVIDEADDVVRAADDVAVKGGAKFGAGFLAKAGSFLRIGAWTTIGIGAVQGIMTGIRTGNIRSAITDFMASISFGIVDSTKEIADDALDKIEDRLASSKPIPVPITLAEAREATPRPRSNRVRGSLIGETTFDVGTLGPESGRIVAPDLSKTERDAKAIADQIERIRSNNPKLAAALETLVDMGRRLRTAVRNREGEGIFRGMIEEARLLGQKFPELAPIVEKTVDRAERQMKRLKRILTPGALAAGFVGDIIAQPTKNWNKLIDNMIRDAQKLRPAARKETIAAITAMIDEMERRKTMPAAKIQKLRELVQPQLEKLTENTDKETKKAAKRQARNAAAAAKVAGLLSATAGRDAIAISRMVTIGTSPVSEHMPETKAIINRWKSVNIETIAPGAADLFKAGGGIIGKAGERGRDLIPAVLGRGEMVFNKFHQDYVRPAVQAFYGHNLEDVFKRIRGQHAGGAMPFGFSGGYAGRAPSGDKTVPIPAQYTAGTPEFIAQRVLGTAVGLLKTYKMVVSDAFATAGHTSPGHLVTGTAMDTYPGPGGSWDLVNKAVAAAAGKGIKVLYDGRFGSVAWPDHGEGNHAHFELGSVVGKIFAAIAPKLKSIDFPWPHPKAVLKAIGQGSVDTVVTVANKMFKTLFEQSQLTGDFAPGSSAGIGADAASRIFQQAFKIARVQMQPGWLSNLVNLATEESTLNPAAQNLTPAGVAAGYPEGILQVTKATFQAYKLPGYDNPFNPLHNAIASIRYQLARYGTIVRNAPYSFGGIVGEYAEGGEIPGHEGQPRPILAHGKEWVLNLAQQARVAAMTGMSRESLKSMLGFYGGPTSYQGGGDTADKESVKEQQRRKVDIPFTTAFEIDRIRAILRGIFNLPTIPLRAWADVVEESNRALQAIRVVGQNLRTRIRNLNRQITRLRRGGVTEGERDDIREAREERERLQDLRRVRGQIRRVERGGVRRGERERLERLETREVKLEAPDRSNFIRTVNNITKDGGLLDQMDEARQRRTEDLANGLTLMTRKIRRRIAGAFARGEDPKIDIGLRIANRELANARKEVTDITAEQGFINKTLKRVNNRLKQLKKGGVSEDEAAEVRQLTQQQNNLRDSLREIKSAHAEALERVFEARKAAVQASIDRVNREAEDREFGFGLWERIAELFGNTGALANIASQRIGSIRTQIAGLQAQIGRAQALGDTDMVRELTQQIGDLQVSIVEIVNQQMTDALETINNAASRRGTRLELFDRMATAIGAVGLGGAATVGGETLTRAGVIRARGESMVQQRSELQQLLRQVQTTPETAQNMQLIQDLTDQLAELDVTIAENTAAAFAARVEEVNRVADFATSVLELRQRIVELTGEISQTDTADQVRALLQERGTILATQRQGLQALLAEAQRAGNATAVNDLTTQLLQNEIATLENTLAIDKLVNKDNLQTFSSSAWTQFRQAIFDGLGNLLPKYALAVPSAQAGARIQQGGLINVHSGEIVLPAKIASSNLHGAGATEYNTDVHLTSPTEVADPVILGNAIGWRIANNPNLRP